MAPEVVDILLDLPLPLLARLGAEGVETAADVVGLYPNVDLFMDALHAVMGTRVDADLSMDVACTYARVHGLARKTKKHAVELVVAERQSVYPSGAAERCGSREAAASSRGMKPLVGLGTGSAGSTVVSGPGPAPASTKADVAKQTKLDLLFHLLVDYVLDLQELGIDTALLADPLGRTKVRETVLHGAQRLSTQRLGALISSFKRWVKFCEERQWAPNAPKPFQLATYLHCVSQGGPTAASSMHAALKWFADQAGAALDLSHPMVAPYRFHAVTHTARQAPELQPWELINLVCLFGRAKGNHKLLLAWVVMAAISCVRWEHLQRSSFVAGHTKWIEFHCQQGKARKKGARPAYGWALPEWCWEGHGVGRILEDFYRHEVLATAGFLVPALQLAADNLWEVTETTPLVLGKPMSRGRFLEIFRGALMQCGLDTHSAKGATFNRLRRFLPTLGNVLEISDVDAQAVGNWTEVPQGGGLTAPRPKAAMTMGRHYGGHKVLRSAVVKVRLLERFLELWKLQRQHVSLTAEGLLPVDSWRWPDLQALHRQTPWSAADPDLSAAITDAAAPAPEQPGEEQPGEEQPDDQAATLEEPAGEPEAASGASGDDSSSASDISADADDLVGILPDPTAAAEIKWFRQGTKTHLVSDTSESDRLIPYCRDKPFDQDPARRGEGFVRGGLECICKRCLSRMPRGLYLSLAEHCGWSS